MFFAYRVMNAGDSSSSPPLSSLTSAFYLAEPCTASRVRRKIRICSGRRSRAAGLGAFPMASSHCSGFFHLGGRTARKLGHPQVLRMLLALHTLFPPGRTTLSITTLPGVAQQKVTMNFKALRKHFTADRRANARPRALPDLCPHGTTGSSPAS